MHCRLVGMSPSSTADDLLSTGSNKKSMLKQGASWKIGPIRQVDAKHLDEGAMRMQIQVQCSLAIETDQGQVDN